MIDWWPQKTQPLSGKTLIFMTGALPNFGMSQKKNITIQKKMVFGKKTHDSMTKPPKLKAHRDLRKQPRNSRFRDMTRISTKKKHPKKLVQRCPIFKPNHLSTPQPKAPSFVFSWELMHWWNSFCSNPCRWTCPDFVGTNSKKRIWKNTNGWLRQHGLHLMWSQK